MYPYKFGKKSPPHDLRSSYATATLYLFSGLALYSASVMVYQIYLYPSLYLALDRFIAVAFFHKAFAVTPKARRRIQVTSAPTVLL